MKKEERILNALNDVDDGYITSAAPNKKATKKRPIKKWTAIAACLAVVAVLSTGIVGLNANSKKVETATLENGEKITFVKSNPIQKDNSLACSVTEKKLNDEQIKKLFGDLPIKANAVYSDEDGSLVGIIGKVGSVSVEIELSSHSLRDTVIESEVKSYSTVNEVDVCGTEFVTDKNSVGNRNVIYTTTFKLGNADYYIENAGDYGDRERIKNDTADVVYILTKNGGIDTEFIK